MNEPLDAQGVMTLAAGDRVRLARTLPDLPVYGKGMTGTVVGQPTPDSGGNAAGVLVQLDGFDPADGMHRVRLCSGEVERA